MYRTVVSVEGMMCAMCEKHVNEAVKNVMKVKKVTSDHKADRTEILSKEAPDEALIRDAICEEGYTVSGFSVEEV